MRGYESRGVTALQALGVSTPNRWLLTVRGFCWSWASRASPVLGASNCAWQRATATQVSKKDPVQENLR